MRGRQKLTPPQSYVISSGTIPSCRVTLSVAVANTNRFNVKYAEETYGHQPVHNAPGVWKYVPL